MDKELKQTLLAICQKYDINSRYYSNIYSNMRPHLDMWVDGNDAKIKLSATENCYVGGSFHDLDIKLEVCLGGLNGYRYKANGIICATDMLARAAGVAVPAMSAEKQDLLDVYTAMRKKVDAQQRAKSAVLSALEVQDLQRAFNIQLNEKSANVR